MDTIAERVERGARLLDEKVPGWAERVDAAALDLESSNECVLGQLFGDYTSGAVLLGLTDPRFSWSMDPEKTNAHGFSDTLYDLEWAALEAAWRVEVDVRTFAPQPA